ncbi:ABC transporter ATP-binding protein [Salinisphaera sp. Q1T1-3]|uniref:ABC transporter ATP-binding protein n=1 Tax=Salinisphaera sp. Q1T1-3 TaxID=2321229 RepID=UPI0011C485AE|nr:ABC transporter ATP-binding protein [Salinisphaera sp. Q1T1-3]
MQLIRDFFRNYPKQVIVVWLALSIASVAEGLSLSTLLPLLSIATGDSANMVGHKTTDFLTQTLHWASINPTISTMVVLVVIGLVVKAGLTLLAYREVGYTVAAIATDTRLAFLRALSASRWEYFLSQRTGRLANSISTEATNSAGAFQSLANLASISSQSAVFLAVALLINWKIAGLAILIGAGIFMLLKIMVSISREAGSQQKGAFQQLMALLTDSLSSLKPLKAMAREQHMDQMLERQTRHLNDALRTSVLASETLKAVQELLIGLVLVAGVAASLTLLDLELSEIMVLTIVLARLLTKLSKLQQEYQKLVSKEAFYWAMDEAIDEARDAREEGFGERSPSLHRGIRLEHVSFAYGGRTVLHDVDIDIPAGQFTTLVGFSGAGKTTLIDLIIGLLRASSGRVLIDDAPIDDLDIRAWRHMIGYVPQDTVLLHETVYNNIAIGDDSLTEADVETALRKAGAWAFVSALSEGMHTSVGEHGGRLSGGQRQRIVIARALVHKPRLVILDEATSALDPDTEREVSATLAALGEEHTVLAVSHRAALTERSDIVYRIENGHATRMADDARATA